DQRTVRFGVDQGSASLENLRRTGRASLQIADGELIFLIKGRARLIAEQMRSAPFGFTLFSLEIVAVRDQSWAGVAVAPFNYQWPRERRKMMERVQAEVFKEMREY